MKRIYLSHPFGGKEENREKAAELAAAYQETWEAEGKDLEIVNPLTYFKDMADLPEKTILRMAVNLMCSCDGVLFAPGWKRNRGCRYEHWISGRKNTLPIYFRRWEIPEEVLA